MVGLGDGTKGWPRGAAPGHGRADWWHGWNVDFKHEQTVNLLACVGQEGVEFGLARKPWAQPVGERGTHPHLHGSLRTVHTLVASVLSSCCSSR